MKIISVTLLVICLLSSTSCAARLAPAIEITNNSSNGKVLKNIKVNWNGFNVLGVPDLGACSEATRFHYIKNFFGPVHAEWENAKGKKLTKDFIFKKEDLPSYKKRGRKGSKYTYVTLYFTQSDMEYYTSDNPNIKAIESKKAVPCLIQDEKRRNKRRLRIKKEEASNRQ